MNSVLVGGFPTAIIDNFARYKCDIAYDSIFEFYEPASSYFSTSLNQVWNKCMINKVDNPVQSLFSWGFEI